MLAPCRRAGHLLLLELGKLRGEAVSFPLQRLALSDCALQLAPHLLRVLPR